MNVEILRAFLVENNFESSYEYQKKEDDSRCRFLRFVNLEKYTPLSLASEQKKWDLVRYMIKKLIEEEKRYYYDDYFLDVEQVGRVLLNAARFNQGDVVNELLLLNPKRINKNWHSQIPVSEMGFDALDYAVFHGNIEMVKQLIQCGFDPMCNHAVYGETGPFAIGIAQNTENWPIFSFLVTSYFKSGQSLFFAHLASFFNDMISCLKDKLAQLKVTHVSCDDAGIKQLKNLILLGLCCNEIFTKKNIFDNSLSELEKKALIENITTYVANVLKQSKPKSYLQFSSVKKDLSALIGADNILQDIPQQVIVQSFEKTNGRTVGVTTFFSSKDSKSQEVPVLNSTSDEFDDEKKPLLS